MVIGQQNKILTGEMQIAKFYQNQLNYFVTRFNIALAKKKELQYHFINYVRKNHWMKSSNNLERFLINFDVMFYKTVIYMIRERLSRIIKN